MLKDKSDLNEEWQKILKTSKEANLEIISGELARPLQAVEIFLSEKEPTFIEDFFRKANELGAKVVIGVGYKLEEIDLKERLKAIRDTNDMEDGDELEDYLDDEEIERYQRLEGLNSSVGKVTKIDLSFITNNHLVFTLEVVSTTHEFVFFEDQDGDDEQDDDDEPVRERFEKNLTPSAQLAKIVGAEPLSRTNVVKKLWDYIKKNNLQDPSNRRNINADDKLKPIFGKPQVSMFEMTKLVAKHLK